MAIYNKYLENKRVMLTHTLKTDMIIKHIIKYIIMNNMGDTLTGLLGINFRVHFNLTNIYLNFEYDVAKKRNIENQFLETIYNHIKDDLKIDSEKTAKKENDSTLLTSAISEENIDHVFCMFIHQAYKIDKNNHQKILNNIKKK